MYKRQVVVIVLKVYQVTLQTQMTQIMIRYVMRVPQMVSLITVLTHQIQTNGTMMVILKVMHVIQMMTMMVLLMM